MSQQDPKPAASRGPSRPGSRPPRGSTAADAPASGALRRPARSGVGTAAARHGGAPQPSIEPPPPRQPAAPPLPPPAAQLREIECPHCQQIYQLSDQQLLRYAGRSITCKQCKQSFIIPSPADADEPEPLAIDATEQTVWAIQPPAAAEISPPTATPQEPQPQPQPQPAAPEPPAAVSQAPQSPDPDDPAFAAPAAPAAPLPQPESALARLPVAEPSAPPPLVVTTEFDPSSDSVVLAAFSITRPSAEPTPAQPTPTELTIPALPDPPAPPDTPPLLTAQAQPTIPETAALPAAIDPRPAPAEPEPHPAPQPSADAAPEVSPDVWPAPPGDATVLDAVIPPLDPAAAGPVWYEAAEAEMVEESPPPPAIAPQPASQPTTPPLAPAPPAAPPLLSNRIPPGPYGDTEIGEDGIPVARVVTDEEAPWPVWTDDSADAHAVEPAAPPPVLVDEPPPAVSPPLTLPPPPSRPTPPPPTPRAGGRAKKVSVTRTPAGTGGQSPRTRTAPAPHVAPEPQPPQPQAPPPRPVASTPTTPWPSPAPELLPEPPQPQVTAAPPAPPVALAPAGAFAPAPVAPAAPDLEPPPAPAPVPAPAPPAAAPAPAPAPVTLEYVSTRPAAPRRPLADFFAFRTMIAVPVLRALFWAGTLLIIAYGAWSLYAAIYDPFGIRLPAVLTALAYLLIAPIAFRIACEMVIVFFRIEESLRHVRQTLDERRGG